MKKESEVPRSEPLDRSAAKRKRDEGPERSEPVAAPVKLKIAAITKTPAFVEGRGEKTVVGGKPMQESTELGQERSAEDGRGQSARASEESEWTSRTAAEQMEVNLRMKCEIAAGQRLRRIMKSTFGKQQAIRGTSMHAGARRRWRRNIK